MLSRLSLVLINITFISFILVNPVLAQNTNTPNQLTLHKAWFGKGKQFKVETSSGNAFEFKEGFWGRKKIKVNLPKNNNFSYNNGFWGSKIEANSQFGDSLRINRPMHKLTLVNANFSGLNTQVHNILNSPAKPNP